MLYKLIDLSLHRGYNRTQVGTDVMFEVGMLAQVLLLVGILFLIGGFILFALEHAGIRN